MKIVSLTPPPPRSGFLAILGAKSTLNLLWLVPNKLIPLKVHYQYSLNVEIGEPDSPMGEAFTVQKRYRDFLRLKIDLEKKYENQKDGFIKNLAFPPKLHFAISQKIAIQRKITLSSWLNVVVKHEVDCNADFHANPSRSNLQVILPFLTQDKFFFFHFSCNSSSIYVIFHKSINFRQMRHKHPWRNLFLTLSILYSTNIANA